MNFFSFSDKQLPQTPFCQVALICWLRMSPSTARNVLKFNFMKCQNRKQEMLGFLEFLVQKVGSNN